MNKSKWKNALGRSLLLSIIVSFMIFSDFYLEVVLVTGFFLQNFGISNDVCVWIACFGIPALLILLASILTLDSYLSWIISIPVQVLAYSICLYWFYEYDDFAIYAMFCGIILVIETLALGFKTLRRWHIKKKKPVTMSE